MRMWCGTMTDMLKEVVKTASGYVEGGRSAGRRSARRVREGPDIARHGAHKVLACPDGHSPR